MVTGPRFIPLVLDDIPGMEFIEMQVCVIGSSIALIQLAFSIVAEGYQKQLND